MKKVEEAESERSMRPGERCWKPRRPKQLTTTVCRVFLETQAVADEDLMDAS